MIIEQTHRAKTKSYASPGLTTVMLSSASNLTGTTNTSELSPITNPASLSSRMVADAFQINSSDECRNLKMYKVLSNIEAVPFGDQDGENLAYKLKGIAFKYSDLAKYMMPIGRVTDKIIQAQCTLYPMIVEDPKVLDTDNTEAKNLDYDNDFYSSSIAKGFGDEETLRLNDDDIFIAEVGADIQDYMGGIANYGTVDYFLTSHDWFTSLTSASEKVVVFPKFSAQVNLTATSWIELKLDLGYIMLDAAIRDGIYSMANVVETNYR